MSGRYIDAGTKRRLYAASMGRCMNPSCAIDLFGAAGDIIEKAHIDPYCDTADNSYENLIVLCPNCHTEFDKNHAFSPEEVLAWKESREEEVKRFFGKEFASFDELATEVRPLLEENKSIFENYYLTENKSMWDRFEPKLLVNNRKLKELLSANLGLFQDHTEDAYSNRALIGKLLLHIDEFELTRQGASKTRQVLFPSEVNSIFGVAPVSEDLIPLTEALEALLGELDMRGELGDVVLGVDRPYVEIKQNDKTECLYLDDVPRLRQLYHSFGCFRKCEVRLDSLNFALKYIRSQGGSFTFPDRRCLRVICKDDVKIEFVYKYCLSQADLHHMSPENKSMIVNLHNWNGESCISAEAYQFAKILDVELLTMEKFYIYARNAK